MGTLFINRANIYLTNVNNSFFNKSVLNLSSPDPERREKINKFLFSRVFVLAQNVL